MVLVCGALGCPILEKRPYSNSNMEDRLEAASRRYLASPAGARVEPGKLRLSKIFEWYAADFGGQKGVVEFARQYLPATDAKKLGPSPAVSHFEYDWRLNAR